MLFGFLQDGMGLEEAPFFGKKFGEEWSQSLTLACRVSFFFFFFLERIVSFLFSSSFVLRDPARINVEFVKLAVEYDYCVFVSIGN